MHERQWKATWRDEDGEPHTCTFTAPDNRVIAQIDFQFKCIDRGLPIPQVFELEEGRKMIPVVPRLREIGGTR